jgi:hypothetical protein
MFKHSERWAYHKFPALNSVIAGAVLIVIVAISAVVIERIVTTRPTERANGQSLAALHVGETPVQAVPQAPPATQTPTPQTANIDPYRGMGDWVDVYDYALRGPMNIPATVEIMAKRGVRTLFLETGRWKDPQGMVDPGAVDQFLETAHSRGMKVVGWYVPGFGNIERDLRRSMLVLNYKTPSGQQFDGFAPDIETREEVGGNRLRYNAGVADYSKGLRDQAPGAVLGAIVDDAKNNLRVPERHLNFPWQQIGQEYDVIMPMAYWSVTKPASICKRVEYDAEAYVREVASLTKQLMGVDRPLHIVGGIADCVTDAEAAGYVRASKEVGIGGSLYDFVATEANPVDIWRQLAPLN